MKLDELKNLFKVEPKGELIGSIVKFVNLEGRRTIHKNNHFIVKNYQKLWDHSVGLRVVPLSKPNSFGSACKIDDVKVTTKINEN